MSEQENRTRALSPMAVEEVQQLINSTLDERLPTEDVSLGYLSVEKAAALADIRPQTIRKWISQRKIPVYRAGERAVRVKLSDIVKEKDL